MRLHNQQEKLEEENDSIVDYMWNEYELTYSYAAELRSEELTDKIGRASCRERV